MAHTKKYSPTQLASLLPQPAKDANKYSRGKLVCIAGCSDYPGAAALAALAGQRMGAGYTQVFCAPEVVASVRAAAAPSIVVASWLQLSEAFRTKNCHPTAFLVGSGMQKNTPESHELVCSTLSGTTQPVLVDGGGIASLATSDARQILKQRFVDGFETVITPHAGEAKTLADEFGLPTNSPAKLAQLLSLAYGVVAVVKGPTTFVSNGNATYKMNSGTQALAKAGTGDVLAGMIASLLAQGIKSVDACMLGTTLHAHAGIIAAEKFTDICVVPEDIITEIPAAIRHVSKAAAKVK